MMYPRTPVSRSTTTFSIASAAMSSSWACPLSRAESRSSATATEAVRQVNELRPDVTLVDIDLGGESGFEVARRLQRDANGARRPMILISTHSEQDYADLIAASPAVGFLAKSALSGDAIRNVLGAPG